MEKSILQRIKALFSELEELAQDADLDLGGMQELHRSADALAHFTAARRKTLLKEYKDRIPFFKDADFSEGFTFGKCGDGLFWKIVDRVLYICGEGPMWDFCNVLSLRRDDETSAPWRGLDFNVVVIHGGVSSIGSFAFENSKFSDIMIPSSVKTIKAGAFFNAMIQTLLLPETVVTLEDGIACGNDCGVDTLIVSASIPNFAPTSLSGRSQSVAKTVFLTGGLPEDPTPLIHSGLFDCVDDSIIYYPANWNDRTPFFDTVVANCSEYDASHLQKIKAVLVPKI